MKDYRYMLLLAALMTVFGAWSLPAAEDGPPQLSKAIQESLADLEAFDAKYTKLLEAYRTDPSLAKKVAKARSARERFVDQLRERIDKEIEPHNRAIEKLQKSLEKLGKRLDRADPESDKEAALREEIAALEAEVQDSKDAVKALQAVVGGVSRADTGDAGLPAGFVKSLPVLPEGPWQGCHMVYEGKGFHLTMMADGRIYVYLHDPDDDSKTLQPRIEFGHPYVVYNIPGHPHQLGRPIIGFRKAAEAPVMQPETFRLEGLMEDYVEFVADYRFVGNTLWVTGGYKDPADISHPSRYRLATRMRQSHNISDETPQDRRQEILAGCQLETRELVDGRAKKFAYPYAEKMHFHGGVESAQVRGPWKSRWIEFEVKDMDNGLHPYIYTDFAPWQGYEFYYQATDNELRRYKATYALKLRTDD